LVGFFGWSRQLVVGTPQAQEALAQYALIIHSWYPNQLSHSRAVGHQARPRFPKTSTRRADHCVCPLKKSTIETPRWFRPSCRGTLQRAPTKYRTVARLTGPVKRRPSAKRRAGGAGRVLRSQAEPGTENYMKASWYESVGWLGEVRRPGMVVLGVAPATCCRSAAGARGIGQRWVNKRPRLNQSPQLSHSRAVGHPRLRRGDGKGGIAF